ncbi:type 1 glutamine amidotransferase [Streptomyces sp. B6B3]|uniref:type 1 glutamine amidotransferase n=1 Tax=Streptomyces sp. B6B3 TaxID=3153570 RepID=UPI00325DDC3E
MRNDEPARAVVVQHTPRGDAGRFGDWLAAAGVALDVVRGFDGDTVPEDPAGRDAVVVLGGGFMPDDDARAPWLPATRALVAAALRADVPVFGICLGGQLLAQVAGGSVAANTGRPEIGSTPITLRPEAAGDPLFRDLVSPAPAIERHVDAITALPPGATWLAETAACRYQAFRVGRAAWGVQFHPEVAADRVRGWDPSRVRAHGLDPAALHRRAVADESAAVVAWRTVADRFAAVVRAAAGA